MKKLEHYGGNGYDNWDIETGDNVPSETGKFEVKTRQETKSFTSLSQARAYFESIDGEKFIWDMTRIPELLDGYHYPNEEKK